MRKKLLSILLALALCLGMLPAQALAAEEGEAPGEESSLVEETLPEEDVSPVEETPPSEDAFQDEAVLLAEVTSGTCGDNVTWTLDKDGTLTISGSGTMKNFSSGGAVPWYDYRNSVKKVIIESGVTSIGDHAFHWCSSLTDVMLPNSITSIGKNAFDRCTSLTNLVLPNSVTTIGTYAFNCCTGLTDIAIPSGVTVISSFMFCGCSVLTNVTIPDSVTTIGTYAFQACYGLTEVTIPDSVTGIKEYAFSYCSGLTSVTIPDSVTSIDEHAFERCSKLRMAVIPVSVTHMGKFVFAGCAPEDIYYGGTEAQWKALVANKSIGALAVHFEVSGKNIIKYEVPDGYIYFDTATGAVVGCARSVTELDIPDSIEGITVEAIGNNAFKGRSDLTDVTIPSSVKTIDTSAFEGCAALQYMVIPGGVESIGDRAFYGCTELEKVQIPDSVQSIGDSAFEECGGLVLVILGKGVASIGERAFCNCKKLSFAAIPSGVTEIKKQTFSGCEVLDNIKIPESVANIAQDAFDSCTGLHNIYYGGTMQQWTAIMVRMTPASKPLEQACISEWKHFSFGNSDEDFFSDDELKHPEFLAYPMIYSHRDYFKTILEKEYGDESRVAAEFEALCRVATYKAWGGSCYGIAAVEGMVNQGLLPVTAIDSGAAELADVAFPNKDHSVRSLVNYYFMSQNLPIPRYNGVAQRRMTDAAEGKAELKTLIDFALAGEECMFTYYNPGMAHSFIVEAGRQMPDGSYELFGRDNRFHGRTHSTKLKPDDPFDVNTGLPYVTKVKIPEDLASCTVVTPYGQEERVDAFFVISDFSLFAEIDPTGAAVGSAVSLYAEGAAEVPSLLYCLPGDAGVGAITLTDAGGNTLLSNLEAGSGVKDFWYAGGGSTVREVTDAEGNTVLEVRNTAPGLMIELDTAIAGKVYTASNFDGTCAYIGPEGMAAVSSEDTNASAVIDLTNHTVSLENNKGAFSIIVDDPGNSKAIATVTGDTDRADTVTVTADSSGDITLSAPEGTYEVTFTGENGAEVTVPVAVSGTAVEVENPAKLIPCDSGAYTADIEWNNDTFTVTLTGKGGNTPALTGWMSCSSSDGRLISVKGLTAITTGNAAKFSGTVLKDGMYYLFIVDGNNAPIIRKYSLTDKFSQ